MDRDKGITDGGIQPLAHFVDSPGQDAVAVTLEANGKDDPYPTVYVRSKGAVTEHMLPPHPLLDFEGGEYQSELSSALKSVLDPALTTSPQ
jgi:hypothetical protein